MSRRSYSRLDVYRKCPRLYHHKYVVRTPEAPAVWTVGGTAFHSCAEWYLSGALGPEVSPERQVQVWKMAWDIAEREERERNPLATDRPLAEWRAANRGAEDATWWSWHGPKMFEQFIDWWATSGLQVLDYDGPALEREFTVDLDGTEVIVIPDALVVDEHGQIDILDYKSGKPPKESLQLGCYAAGLRVATGLDATWGLYYMTRPATAIPVDLAKWPHQKIVDLFVDFDTREAAGDYSPTPGDHCKFCPIKRDCPIFERKAA